MARLSEVEFHQLVQKIAEGQGLPALLNRLQRTNALVSKRVLKTPEGVARHLHLSTAGLARDCIATQVLLALWEDKIGSKLDRGDAEELENTAAAINECLGTDLEPFGDCSEELLERLVRYHSILARKIGADSARLTMLIRAVPAVASLLRRAESLSQDTREDPAKKSPEAR